MNSPTHFTQEELQYIIANAERFTVQEFAEELALGKSVIYNIGNRYKLKFKGMVEARREAQKPVRARDPKLIPDPPKAVYERVPAMYSNKSPMGIASAERKL